jgi:Acetyl-CoA carboxylase, central region
VLSGRIDATLYSNLKQTANTYKAACTTSSSDSGSSLDATVEFPAASILIFIDEYAESLPERDTAAFASLIEPLKLVTQQYVHGVSGRIMYTLLTLVRQYLSVERGFTGDGMEACIQSLRKTHAGDIPHVYEMCRSHLAITAKNNLLLILLDHVSKVAAHVSKRSDEASNTTDQGTDTFRLLLTSCVCEPTIAFRSHIDRVLLTCMAA